jgi:hypothetical protein
VAKCKEADLQTLGDFSLSVVKNANEFFVKLQGIRNRYHSLFGPRLAQLRSRYTNAEWDAAQQELEFHRRCYIINDLLALLNWRLDELPHSGLPNLIPEQPVTSIDTSRTRFLDYLGFERETERPLLIVEAKRTLNTPTLTTPSEVGTHSTDPVKALVRGLRGEQLTGQWSDWLKTLGKLCTGRYAMTV